jgi:hypothetical protein
MKKILALALAKRYCTQSTVTTYYATIETKNFFHLIMENMCILYHYGKGLALE